MATKNTTYKNWLTVGLVAGALALGACSKKDDTPMETEADTTVDAQTSVEESATARPLLVPMMKVWTLPITMMWQWRQQKMRI